MRIGVTVAIIISFHMSPPVRFTAGIISQHIIVFTNQNININHNNHEMYVVWVNYKWNHEDSVFCRMCLLFVYVRAN